jgi:hypothetical protein
LAGSLGEALQSEIIDRASPRRNERLLQEIYPRSQADAEADQ